STYCLPQNQMFCGGYNAGIRMAMEKGYDFVLMSNADTEPINPKMLEELLAAAHRWPRGAFFGPRVSWKKPEVVQKTCLQFHSFLRNLWLWIPWRVVRSHFAKQPSQERTVEFLNGVCLLCRVAALREIGLMDEVMGGYVEDADWAWRAREKGWGSVFTPVSSIIPHAAATGYEPYSLKSFLLKRNLVYWFLTIGKKPSAWSYAYASIFLACLRLWLAASDSERKKHRYFLRRLIRTLSGLLRREVPGDWFGPPLGSWRNKHVG
ncbi:MAG: glycosyltransferase family 2 protein, partial [Deltaproteobacteria bacterium]|nr:glycosyltransferase family 2 protein [Deltaproteobacteria bacterium]